MQRVSPFALLRLDAAMVDRVRREERLDALALSALTTIVLGAGAYGAAFGLWRGLEQASFSALKLPGVFVGVALLTAASSAVLAPLAGARLRPMQSIVLVLSSLAVTSSILGALAPVAILFVLAATPPAGAGHDAVAQSLVLAHTLVIALAGIAGVLALLHLVTRLVPSRSVARRVVLAWMATQLLTGAQLSWLCRPFLGRAGGEVTFFSPDALNGGFFDEILALSAARFGTLSPFLLGWLALMMAFWIGVALFGGDRSAQVRAWPRGLEVTSSDEASRVVGWGEVRGAAVVGTLVLIRLARDEALVERTVEVLCPSSAAAAHLAGEIESARSRHEVGPYR